MVKITWDLGHALSRLDQHRNRRQPYLISTRFFFLFFLRKSRGEVLKKFNGTFKTENFFKIFQRRRSSTTPARNSATEHTKKIEEKNRSLKISRFSSV